MDETDTETEILNLDKNNSNIQKRLANQIKIINPSLQNQDWATIYALEKEFSSS